MAMSVEEERVVASVPMGLLIGGEWRHARSGNELRVEDPATGDSIAMVADGGPEDAIDALEAASRAQASWAATAPRFRAEILRAAFELIMARQDDLALLMTLEMGKPVAESKGEVAYAAEFFRWFSEEAVRMKGEYYRSPDGITKVLTTRSPVGPCYLITPWNFPLAMGTRKIGPALAAGCTVILKPAEQTPLCSLALGSILLEAGLPAGVLNIVNTSEPDVITDRLIGDTRLRKLSFTGSTEVGKTLMRNASTNLLRLSMELGGNAPLIVFSDADLDKAIPGAIFAKMRNGGEACTSANRILVHKDLADSFSERLAEELSKMKVARGTVAGAQVGPLIDQDALTKVSGLLEEATAAGGRLLTGGDRVGDKGYFYAPTVITGVPRGARIFREEIFGPVAPIYTFDDDDEAYALANDTNYGLVSYIFTESFKRVHLAIDALQSGMVGVNQGLVSNAAAPFGGVKHSGFGREGGFEGIQEYLDVKYAALNLS
ncbi:succinate-semialdehyde dehydrogenase [NADP(+)] GabD [Ferrimicrobium acidiphilum DSM 19497]|uniref:Succinate-semialdehyde dehydrogenase [NADP(+)] GabD n=2 Tax=Ferrimicrobium acidiphilum TaxID=121039 RepID=A0A0D8FTL2_9ACTN|nr:NAD-dependent succinate-semialdehyde dehydrogenase [Ferrimicrobium acidiphilum]KJE76623.1 succinate-semialdehyde dehydrogenase [NADP(+)] GabD [Ferrimicrobium acidiphilum DSM 19497]